MRPFLLSPSSLSANSDSPSGCPGVGLPRPLCWYQDFLSSHSFYPGSRVVRRQELHIPQRIGFTLANTSCPDANGHHPTLVPIHRRTSPRKDNLNLAHGATTFTAFPCQSYILAPTTPPHPFLKPHATSECRGGYKAKGRSPLGGGRGEKIPRGMPEFPFLAPRSGKSRRLIPCYDWRGSPDTFQASSDRGPSGDETCEPDEFVIQRYRPEEVPPVA